jgi:hypothetical protein
MSWVADYTDASDLASVAEDSLSYQIYYAIAERVGIDFYDEADPTSKKLPPIGTDMFLVNNVDTGMQAGWPPTRGTDPTVFSISYAQWLIAEWFIGSSWVRTKTAGGQDGKTDFDYYTTATLYADAGMNASGFERHIPHTNGDGGYTVAYGYFQAGDYVGPHLFNELKHCLQLLTTVATGFAISEGEDPAMQKARYGFSVGVTKAAARTDAEAQFNFGYVASHNLRICCFSKTQEAGGYWYATLERTSGRGKVYIANPHIECDFDCYVKVNAPSFGAWDDNGDFAGYENKWKFCETINFTIGDEQELWTDSFVGGNNIDTVPVWHDIETKYGWEFSYSSSVRRFDGHFQYGST